MAWFPEQLAITPDGRTSTSCGGIYDDAHIEGLSRVTAIIKDMGAVAAIQLGHTGRKGSEATPWQGGGQMAFMLERSARVRREIVIPVGVSWNLGLPAVADQMIRTELIDLVLLVRPALSNPHRPVWAARELAHPDPFSLVPQDWG